MLTLTEIQILTGFTSKKHARNISDWLRKARTGEAIKRGSDIVYEREFVCDVLRDKLTRIETHYPEQYASVCSFLNGWHTTSYARTQPLPNINTTYFNYELFTEESETEPTPEPLPVAEPVQNDSNEVSDQTTQEANRLADFLTNPRTMIWGTVFAIGIFLPFTVLNLYQYIAIETGSNAGAWGVLVLCCLIAAVWDFSILLFAVNAKKRMAKVGAFVLFIFMGAKFDFFTMLIDGLGWDGESFQLFIVKTAIVLYSPLLVHQFTVLATRKRDGDVS